jgi:2-dehydro-3-deoxyphosphogluconate aldolase / (4S)-4-hydroxy-2-oxoglutarate aldolase
MEANFFDRIHSIGLIPVVEIDSADLAVPLAEALYEGGLPIIEVTLRTEAAVESIRQISKKVPNVLVGAGTIINPDQAKLARQAGAQYFVSPGLDEETVHWAFKNELPILPGALTPTEIMKGLRLGLKYLKFFPAEVSGGLKAIKAISDPFPDVRFIPTGGVNANNLAEYLQAEKIHAAGGSWMAKRQMIKERRFEEILQLAKEATAIVKKTRAR